ncbi:MAG: hypothetical protein AAFY08_12975 [Planctomycetota bacterium]
MSEETRWIDRAGRFRGSVSDARIVKADSGAVALELDVLIEEMYDADAWHNWREYGITARGALWIIKKDGSLNEMANETARDVLGWDGDPTDLSSSRFNPVSIVVEADEYKGKVRHKVQWFNKYDETGLSRGASTADIGGIQASHGSKLRAFYGAKGSSKPAAGKPNMPPAPPVPAGGIPEDDIPF